MWSSYNKALNPVDSLSKDFSQWEVDSYTGDDYENTLRAFELSQMNQRQRKPRTSNFIGEADIFMFTKNRLSICRSSHKMNTIQEDDQSSKSNHDDESNDKSVTTLSEQGDFKPIKLGSVAVTSS